MRKTVVMCDSSPVMKWNIPGQYYQTVVSYYSPA